MKKVDLNLYERSAIDTFENETGEVLFDLTDLCNSFAVNVTAIINRLSGIRFGIRDGVEHILADEDVFFRAVFLIMEYQKQMYASEVLRYSNKG